MGQGNVYLPIFFLGLLAFGFAVFSVAAASFTGPKRYNRAKVDAYECGIQPAQAQLGGGRFPVKYYITAMLFIIFDIEIVDVREASAEELSHGHAHGPGGHHH